MTSLLAALAVMASPQTPQLPADGASVDVKVLKTVTMRYLVYVPEDYSQDRNKKFPLLLFLHGSGERGDNVEKVRVHGPLKETAAGRKLPFIVIAPQCPDGTWWETENLIALLDRVEKLYRVDKSREYLSGLSMGGYGSWGLAIAQPKRFAAVAICCGGGDPKKVGVLKKVPIWVVHGDADQSVPLQEDVAMVEALRAAGGNVRFDIIKDGTHDIWTDFYGKSDVFNWFLQYRR